MPPRKNQTEKTEDKQHVEPKVETKVETKEEKQSKVKKEKVESKKAEKKEPVKKETVKKDPTEKKTKVKPDRTSVCAEMKEVAESVQRELTRIRTDKPKTCNTKYLYELRTKLTSLSKKMLVVLKCKTTRNVNKNSGFGRPMQVTQAMSTFLGKDNKVLVSRVEASQAINKYIQTAGKDGTSLYNKELKKVVSDKKLRDLLGVDNFQYLGEFQRLLSKHFIQPAAAVTAPKK